MKSHYVSKNPDKYLELEKEKKVREQAAEEVNAQNAGNGNQGGGGDNLNKVSKEVKVFIEESRKIGRVLTIEQAERALKIKAQNGHIG